MQDQDVAASTTRRWVAAMIVAALALLSACSSDDDETPVADAAPAPVDDTESSEPVDAGGDAPDEQPTPSSDEPEAVEPEDTTPPDDLPTGPPPTPTPDEDTPAPTPEAAPTREPVPSDELEVTVPSGAVEDPPTVSDGTALACAATEEAIEFVDFGDVERVSAALDAASAHASTATEPDMAAQADVLASFDGDLDSAFDIIVSTLNICSAYGYEV